MDAAAATAVLRFTWGRQVRALRMAAGMTQDQVSDVLGIPLKAYQRLETGRHNPTLDTIGRVAHALGVPVAEFFASAPTPETRAMPELPRGWKWRRAGVPVYGSMVEALGEGDPIGHAMGKVPGRVRGSWLALAPTPHDARDRGFQARRWMVLQRPAHQPWLGKQVIAAGAGGELALWRVAAMTAGRDGTVAVHLERPDGGDAMDRDAAEAGTWLVAEVLGQL